MGEYFRHFDLMSWDIWRDILFDYGWIIALPWALYCIAVKPGSRSVATTSWQTLPFLAWAAVATWRQSDYFFTPVGCMGPPKEFYLTVPLVNFLALCLLSASHALVCTLAGQPSWTLGRSVAQRAVAHVAVLATLADGLFVAAAIRSFAPGGATGGLPLVLN